MPVGTSPAGRVLINVHPPSHYTQDQTSQKVFSSVVLREVTQLHCQSTHDDFPLALRHWRLAISSNVPIFCLPVGRRVRLWVCCALAIVGQPGYAGGRDYFRTVSVSGGVSAEKGAFVKILTGRNSS